MEEVPSEELTSQRVLDSEILEVVIEDQSTEIRKPPVLSDRGQPHKGRFSQF